MAYNLSPTTAPVFSLPDHALVTLEGPDAVAFAHAQFANDVAALAPGCWQWNAWLTPKGRVIAVFALARPAEDRVWLVLPDHPAELFAEALRRFVFRRKLKIEVPADRAISGANAAPAHAQGNLLGTAGDAVESGKLILISPCGVTGWHLHPVPSFGMVVQGELEVSLKDGRTKRMKAGDALAEVVNTAHNGRSFGSFPEYWVGTGSQAERARGRNAQRMHGF